MAEDKSMALMEAIRQQGGGDFLRSLVEEVLERLMGYEVAAIACGVNAGGRREITGAGRVGGQGVLAGVPARPAPAGAGRGAVDHLRRPRRFEGRHRPDLHRDLAALPRALHAQPPGLRPEGRAALRRHAGAAGVRPARRRQRRQGVAAGPPTSCGPGFRRRRR